MFHGILLPKFDLITTYKRLYKYYDYHVQKYLANVGFK